MKKALSFGILCLSFVISINAAVTCPGLPETDGMEIKCVNPKDNSTVDCSSTSSSTVPKGTVAHYRCVKGDNTEFQNKTLSCTCKGRWRGVLKFNEVAAGCGGGALDLSLGTASSNSTVPDNSTSGEDNVDDANTSSEGGEASGTTHGSITVGNETTSLSSILMRNPQQTEQGNNSNSNSQEGNVTAEGNFPGPLHLPPTGTSQAGRNETHCNCTTQAKTDLPESKSVSTSSPDTTASPGPTEANSDITTTESATNNATATSSESGTTTLSSLDLPTSTSLSNSSTTASDSSSPASSDLTSTTEATATGGERSATEGNSTLTDAGSTSTPSSSVQFSVTPSDIVSATITTPDSSFSASFSESDNNSSATTTPTPNETNSTSTPTSGEVGSTETRSTQSEDANSTTAIPPGGSSTALVADVTSSSSTPSSADSNSSSTTPTSGADTSDTSSTSSSVSHSSDSDASSAASSNPRSSNGDGLSSPESAETSSTPSETMASGNLQQTATSSSSVSPSEGNSDASTPTSEPSNGTNGPPHNTPSAESSSTPLPDSGTTTGREGKDFNLGSTEKSQESASAPEESSNFTDFQLKSLELHNILRKDHKSQPIMLNHTLNEIAQEWAEKAVSEPKLQVTPGKRRYAENIYRVSGGNPLTAVEAVQLAFNSWNKSSTYYNYEHPYPTAFSQMAWNRTTQLGTGVATSGSKTVVVAAYSPRGNVVLVTNDTNADPGFFFKQNVFPCETEKVTENMLNSTTQSDSSLPSPVTSEAGATTAATTTPTSSASAETTPTAVP